MIEALGVAPPPAPVVEDPVGNLIEDMGEDVGQDIDNGVQAEIEGLGLNVRLGRDGSFDVGPADRRRDPVPAGRRDDRRAPDEEGDPNAPR